MSYTPEINSQITLAGIYAGQGHNMFRVNNFRSVAIARLTFQTRAK
jgi:hypothetical protein